MRIRITRTPNGVTYSADRWRAVRSTFRAMFCREWSSPVLSHSCGGKTLNALMLDRDLNPGQLIIVREIVTGTVELGIPTCGVLLGHACQLHHHQQPRRRDHREPHGP